MTIKTHFGRRCIERGIKSVHGDRLGVEIHDHTIGRKKSCRVERVGVYGSALFYRLIVDEGVFFCPVSESGWPFTLYTPEMFRKRRRSKKMLKKAVSHKDYRGSRK